MSEDLGLLVKKEVPFQCIDNDKIQVTLPILPDILGLPKAVRLDPQIAAEVFARLPEGYERDMANYIAFLDENAHYIPGLENFARFRPDWVMTTSRSETGMFLDFSFRMNGSNLRLGYDGLLVLITNWKNDNGMLVTPEECISDPFSLEVTVFYRNQSDSDLIFFTEDKFRRFRPIITTVDRDTFEEREIAMHALTSSHVDLVPHGLLIRNFGIGYLNELAKRAMNPQLPKE